MEGVLGHGCARVLGLGYRVCPRAEAWVSGVPACWGLGIGCILSFALAGARFVKVQRRKSENYLESVRGHHTYKLSY